MVPLMYLLCDCASSKASGRNWSLPLTGIYPVKTLITPFSCLEGVACSCSYSIDDFIPIFRHLQTLFGSSEWFHIGNQIITCRLGSFKIFRIFNRLSDYYCEEPCGGSCLQKHFGNFIGCDGNTGKALRVSDNSICTPKCGYLRTTA